MKQNHHPALYSLIKQDVALQVNSVQRLLVIGHEFEKKYLHEKAEVFS